MHQFGIVLQHGINLTVTATLGVVIFSSSDDVSKIDESKIKNDLTNLISAMLRTHSGELESVDDYLKLYLTSADSVAKQNNLVASFVEAHETLRITP